MAYSFITKLHYFECESEYRESKRGPESTAPAQERRSRWGGEKGGGGGGGEGAGGKIKTYHENNLFSPQLKSLFGPPPPSSQLEKCFAVPGYITYIYCSVTKSELSSNQSRQGRGKSYFSRTGNIAKGLCQGIIFSLTVKSHCHRVSCG